MVLASMFLTTSIPRMNLTTPKSLMQNWVPMIRFADSVHSRDSETMQIPCTFWFMVYRTVSDVARLKPREEERV
jgi:hypothetical protein